MNSLRDLWDTIKQTDRHLGVPEIEEREKGQRIFEGIISDIRSMVA